MPDMAKWIDDARPDERISCLAARALESRLQAAGKYLQSAAEEAHLDHEHIHDLRVATRRAVAALDLFADLVPRRQGKWFRKKLREARRTAGEARDLDVFDVHLAEWIGDGLEGRIIREQIAESRHDVQPRIKRLYEKLCKKDFRRRGRRIIKRVRWRHDDGCQEPTVKQTAQARCRPLVDRFIQASRADLTDQGAQHLFRVAGKHLRYALEIFSGALGPSFRDNLYPQLVELQDRLGDANDLAAAIERLNDWRDGSKDEVKQKAFETAAEKVARAYEERRLHFHQWWTNERNARFLTLLDQVLQPQGESLGNGFVAPSRQEAPIG